MLTDSTGYMPTWAKATLIVVGTALFVVAVIATAGGAAALAGLGVGLLGASASTASAVVTAVTIGSYVVAGGIGIIGASEAVNTITGNNFIRDNMMSGNQVAYNTVKYSLIATGAAIVTAGTIAPYLLKNSYTTPSFNGNNLRLSGQNPNSTLTNVRSDGFQTNVFDRVGNWVCRIDAYTHKGHINPHVHFGNPNSQGLPVRKIFDAISNLFN
jgi:hypothetical protein